MTDDAFPMFTLPPTYAVLSDDGRYRYTLGRRWTNDLTAAGLVFIMLNPSTATAEEDDPTIRRCIRFARDLGYGGLHVVNLYAYRATKPADLWKAADPVGPDNDRILTETMDRANREGRPVIAAWGTNARPDRVRHVLSLPGADSLTALRTTKDGHPSHPLYLPATLRPTPWKAP